jgi:hypothetical protein
MVMTNSQRKLTLRVARDYIRILGGTLKHDTDWQEYILRFGTSTYHATELDDVIGTAKVWQGTNPNLETAERLLVEFFTTHAMIEVLRWDDARNQKFWLGYVDYAWEHTLPIIGDVFMIGEEYFLITAIA